MIMGSNMAECHPVAFRWVIKGKEKGAKLIHVDPRFTRTSAMADQYVPIRAGGDIAFLGGMINWLLNNPKWLNSEFHREYVSLFTNMSTIVSKDYKGADELDGVFSGLAQDGKSYNSASWQYQRDEAQNKVTGEEKTYAEMLTARVPGTPKTDPTWQDPNCVYQILKRHYARYTPEMIEKTTGTPKELFLKTCEVMLENSGRDKTGCIVYSVGWAQHSFGVQIIRASGIVQALLGNMGRPGSGILALRGHATIQGSTDISTLYHSWNGYLANSDARRNHATLKDYILTESHTTSFWSNTPAFVVSMLKAWFGDAATPENEFGYNSLPKLTADHSHMPTFVAMQQGGVEGMLAIGQNPAVGGQNSEFQRQAMGKLKWLVVRDYFDTETATFWKRPGVNPKDIQTEVIFLPAAHVAEGDGTFTNTSRLLQKHEKAVDPPGDARTDLWFSYHLGARLKKLYTSSTNPRDWAIKNLYWDYLDEAEQKAHGWKILDEPSADKILKEINGFTWADKKLVAGFTALKDDGTTACGAWIYSGVYPAEGRNLAAARKGDNYVSPGWGFSWPANRHIMYSRASADGAGNPWSEKKKFTYWDAARDTGTKDANGNPILGQWVNAFGDAIDFPVTKAPTAKANPKGLGLAFHDGASPAIMRQDGKFWLFAPGGTIDGPLPTQYEPVESPVKNPMYKQQRNPLARMWDVKGNRYHEEADAAKYPMIISTYRVTEHYLAGGMSRWLPWLAELMPEFFIEISEDLAKEKGVANGDYVVVETKRGEVEGRALVTKRLKPYNIDGKVVHEVGMPWHWGKQGLASGDSANDVVAMIGDPNTTIHEGKVFSGNLRKGRRSKQAPDIFAERVAMDMDSEMTLADVQHSPFLGEVENA